MLTISDATAQGQPTSTSCDQPSAADEQGKVSEFNYEEWQAEASSTSRLETILDVIKIIGLGSCIFNWAFCLLLFPLLSLGLPVPFAIFGVGLLCVGIVLLGHRICGGHGCGPGQNGAAVDLEREAVRADP